SRSTRAVSLCLASRVMGLPTERGHALTGVTDRVEYASAASSDARQVSSRPLALLGVGGLAARQHRDERLGLPAPGLLGLQAQDAVGRREAVLGGEPVEGGPGGGVGVDGLHEVPW